MCKYRLLNFIVQLLHSAVRTCKKKYSVDNASLVVERISSWDATTKDGAKDLCSSVGFQSLEIWIGLDWWRLITEDGIIINERCIIERHCLVGLSHSTFVSNRRHHWNVDAHTTWRGFRWIHSSDNKRTREDKKQIEEWTAWSNGKRRPRISPNWELRAIDTHGRMFGAMPPRCVRSTPSIARLNILIHSDLRLR